MILSSTNFTDLYVDALRCLLHESTPYAAPRGKVTKEQLGSYLVLHQPDQNLLVSPERKLNYSFCLAEWAWILVGSNDLQLIKPYNAIIDQFSDEGLFLSGAYGPKLLDQLPYVLKTLTDDPWSRQAVVSLWRERPGPSKDIPCTVDLQFFLRPRNGFISLDLVTHMRSNDAWLGLPYDVFVFTMIQKYVAALLKAGVGDYRHFAGSLHLYEQDWKRAQAVIDEAPSVTWRPSTTTLSAMPPDFKAMFTALTLLAKYAESHFDMLSWLTASDTMPQPWQDYIQVLGYRFHKDKTYLPNPWNELIAGRKV